MAARARYILLCLLPVDAPGEGNVWSLLAVTHELALKSGPFDCTGAVVDVAVELSADEPEGFGDLEIEIIDSDAEPIFSAKTPVLIVPPARISLRRVRHAFSLAGLVISKLGRYEILVKWRGEVIGSDAFEATLPPPSDVLV